MRLSSVKSQLKKENLFLIVTFLFYFLLNATSFNCGFFSDDYLWLRRFSEMGFSGLLNNYNDSFFLPFTFLFQQLEYEVFGEFYIAYKIVNFILIFSIYVIYFKLFKAVLITFTRLENVKQLVYLSSLIFLLLPYQTEVVNWYSSQSYLLSTLFFLISIYHYQNKLFSSRWKGKIASLFFFLLSIMSKEVGIVYIPIIFILSICVFKERLINAFSYLFFLLLILLLYFSLKVVVIGDFIGGYGNSIHLNLDLNLIIFNQIAYYLKFFLMYRYFDFRLALFLIIISLIYFVFRIIRDKRNRFYDLKFLILLNFIFCISTLPVINLETSFLGSIQSDRYGFLPSLFSSVIFAFLILGVTIKDRKILVLPIIFSLSYFLVLTNLKWDKASEIRNVFSSFFKSQKGEKTLILNIPDNYEGVYLFRNGFYELIKGLKHKDQIKVVSLYEMYEVQNIKVDYLKSTLYLNKGRLILNENKIGSINLNRDELYFNSKKIKNVFYFNNYRLIKLE